MTHSLKKILLIIGLSLAASLCIGCTEEQEENINKAIEVTQKAQQATLEAKVVIDELKKYLPTEAQETAEKGSDAVYIASGIAGLIGAVLMKLKKDNDINNKG
jgi:hypothetical protein